ncbi:MAG: SpaA isopeptide-forming pilin-related protein, partial [Acidimicrobiia bacterium]|nr:SpaA isopeptide-forming pilin-related protein [Acidimicrobiia bacterium]
MIDNRREPSTSDTDDDARSAWRTIAAERRQRRARREAECHPSEVPTTVDADTGAGTARSETAPRPRPPMAPKVADADRPQRSAAPPETPRNRPAALTPPGWRRAGAALLAVLTLAIGLATAAVVPQRADAAESPLTPSYSDTVGGSLLVIGNTAVRCLNATDPDTADVDGDGDRTESVAAILSVTATHMNGCSTESGSTSGTAAANDRRWGHRVNSDTTNVCTTLDRSATPPTPLPTGCHFGSSSATVQIPADTQIKFARLIWSGNYANGALADPQALPTSLAVNGAFSTCQNNAVDDNFTTYPSGGALTDTTLLTRRLRQTQLVGNPDQVLVKANTGAYTAVTAGSRFDDSGSSFTGQLYTSLATITGQLQSMLTANATPGSPTNLTITVANVATGTGPNCTGGWTLLVVYEAIQPCTGDTQYRNVQLFDGHVGIAASSAPQTATVTNVVRPLASEVRVGVVAAEGDQGIVGDYFEVNGSRLVEPKLGVNNNYFASTVSADQTSRNPAAQQNDGQDTKIQLVSSSVLPAGTVVNVPLTFGTSGDRYAAQATMFTSEAFGVVCGHVRWDVDRNGTGDNPLAGVTLTLRRASDNTVATDATGAPTIVTTNAEGRYTFINIVPGEYYVAETDPAGFTSVSDGDTSPDGDTTPNTNTNDNRIPVTITESETDANNDFVDRAPIDLALRKTVQSQSSTPLQVGGTVTYQHTVFNQGQVPMFRVEVTDTPPAGLTFTPGGVNAAWTAQPSGQLRATIAGPIPPGGSATVTLTLGVATTTFGTTRNTAEISAADTDTNTTNAPPIDDDSTWDANPGDALVDDQITGVPPVDEDDHDIADLTVRTVALGNEVFLDLDDDGIKDPGELPAPNGVVVNLYNAAAPTTLVQTTTLSGGRYSFDTYPGGWIVELAASNFAPGGALAGYRSSTGVTATNTDGRDRGAPAGSAIRTGTITLAYGTAPTGENPQYSGIAADNDANMTVDFGVYKPPFRVGGTLWRDADADGTLDLAPAETGIGGVTVNLYRDSDGTPGISPGDTLVGQVNAAAGTGFYDFTALEAGNYYVGIPATQAAAPNPTALSGFVSSAIGEEADPDSDGDGNDNGVSTLTAANAPVAGLYSGVLTLGESGGFAEPVGEAGDTGTVTPDNQSNLTVDFGFVPPHDLSVTKALTSTGPYTLGGQATFLVTVTNAATCGPNACGTASGVHVVDQLPAGLALAGHTASAGTTYTPASGDWNVGNLAPGASATLTLTATVLAGGTLTNYAQVSATTAGTGLEWDSVPADNPGPVPGTPTANPALPAGTNTHDDEAAASLTNDVVDLSLTKSAAAVAPAGGAPWRPGDLVDFTVTVTNAATCGAIACATATGVTVADTLPAALSWVSDNSAGAYAPGSGIWTVPSLTPGASATLVVRAQIGAAGTFTNFAAVHAIGQSDLDSDPGDNPGPAPAATEADAAKPGGQDVHDDEAAVSLVVPLVDLSLTKSHAAPADGIVNLGDEITFTVTVSNAASCGATAPACATATGVTVTDVLPAGLTYTSHTAGAGTFTPGTGVWNVGSLAPGALAVLTLSATVDALGPLANFAQVATTDQADVDSTPGDNAGIVPAQDDEAVDTVAVAPVDLAVTKTVSAPGGAAHRVGDTVTFSLSVANAASCGGAGACVTATGVTVSDALPAGLEYVSDNAGSGGDGTYDDATGVWDVGSLAPGATAALQIVARIVDGGTLTNLAQAATADQSDVDSTPANNAGGAPAEDDEAAATVDVPVVDLSLTKSVAPVAPATGAPYRPGEQVTFTLALANAAACGAGACRDATGVTVIDVLPAGYTFVSASAAAYDDATGVWTVGTLAAGATATLDVVATIEPSGERANYAQVGAANETDVDSQPADNAGPVPGTPEADATLLAGTDTHDDEAAAAIAVPYVDLTVAKTVGTPADGAVNPGDEVTFSVTVSNATVCSGEPCAAATGVVVADALPVGLTYVSHSGPGTYAGGLWSLGAPLAPGTNAVLQITATVDALGPLVNYAQVAAVDQADVDSDPADNAGPAPGSPQADPTKPGGADTHDDEAASTVAVDLVDLSLTKVSAPPADGVLNPGDEVTFTLTVANAATCGAFGACVGATGVTVADPVPAGTTFVSATGAGSYDDATGVWTVGTVPAGSSRQLALTVVVTSLSAQNYAQVATAAQTDIDSQPADNAGPDPAAPEADASLPSGTDTHDDEAAAPVAAPIVDLSVTKTAAPADPIVNVGDQVSFTITVANAAGCPDGTSPCATATGVVVGDVLPDGFGHVSDDGAGAYDPGSGVWTVPGGIAPGASAALVLTATVAPSGARTNYAQVVDADQFDLDSDPADNAGPTPATPEADAAKPGGTDDHDDEAAVTVRPALVDLSLAKAFQPVADGVVNLGDSVTFALTVANAATCADGGTSAPCATATGVTVLDAIPAGLTWLSDDSGGAYVPGTGVWTVPDVAPGANRVLTVTARVDSLAGATNYAQIASAAQDDVDSQPADNPGPAPLAPEADASLPSGTDNHDDEAAATLAVPVVDLSLTKTVDAPADGTWNLGDTVTFTLVATNAGGCLPSTACADATGVTVADPLPAGLTVLTQSGDYDSGTGVWTIGDLAASDQAALTITARIDDPGDLVNYAQVATVDQTDLDSDPGDNPGPAPAAPEPDPIRPGGEDVHDDEAAATVSVPVVDLSVAKAVAPALGAYRPGDTVTFTVTVTNAATCGAAACAGATGVVVADPLPAGLVYVSDTAGGAYVPATGQWTLPAPLAAGASASFDVVATIAATGERTNYAQVAAADQSDLDSDPADNPGPAPAAPEPDAAKPGGTDTHDDEAAVAIPVSFVDLSLTKVAGAPADGVLNPGEQIDFTLTVANAATCAPSIACVAATGVTVADALPAGLGFVAASGDGTYDAPSGVWTVGTIPPGGSRQLTLTVTVDEPTARNYAQVATVDQPDADSDPGDNAGPTPATTEADATKPGGQDVHDDEASATVGVPHVDLSLTKTATPLAPGTGSPWRIGDQVSFTLSVANAADCTPVGPCAA